jgi:hypothetical protein
MANEKRLIDANELQSKLQGHHDFFVDGWGGFDKMSFAAKCRVDEIDNCIAEIVNAPTVDAVEVVRCKDCKHYKEDTLTCIPRLRLAFEHPNYYPEDFCSYGERKDNE